MPSQPRSGQAPKKRSAMWLIIGAMGLFVFLLLVLGVTVLMRPAPPLNVPAAEKIILADGTELFVQVTYGKQHEWMGQRPVTNSIERVFRETQPIAESRSTGQDCYMIWLAGIRPDGSPDDLTWWGYSSVVDQFGDEVRDGDLHKQIWHFRPDGSSGSGSGADRPLSPLTVPASIFIVNSVLPAFHTNQTSYKLRLHDTTGQVVASLNLPIQHSVPTVKWAPDSLPITKQRGKLGVTLTRVDYELAEPTDDDSRPAVRVTPRFEATWDGERFGEWSRSIRVYDSLGNSDDHHRVRLSPKADAWKLQLTLRRSQNADFAPEEQWQAREIMIPAEGQHQMLAEQGVIKGSPVELKSVGGRGNVSYDLPNAAGKGGSYSSSGSVPGPDGRIEYQIKFRSRDQVNQISVESKAVHLVAAVQLNPGQHLIVTAVDDQGREVKTFERDRNELRLIMFGVASDAKSITPTFIVHGEETFDFFIDPPNDLLDKSD